jgi:two-component system OmpR family response regulator
LSALSDVDEKVKGLRAGGDDYLAKPYAFTELLARVETLARRRAAEPQPTRLRTGDLEIDLLARTASGPASPFCCSRGNSSCSNISCAMPATW